MTARTFVLLPTVELGAFRIDGARVLVALDDRSDAVVFTTVLNVRDVSSGQQTTVNHQARYARSFVRDREAIAEAIRELVIGALAHEVDEWLRVDGARVQEPHPRVPSSSTGDASGG
ncbi:MAG TPA: hypothetical protein VHM19_22985 [Polyangiales bacterium]|jgi:hypothetical protein|nr:hypothetical protein [Polyangiales bacterium]